MKKGGHQMYITVSVIEEGTNNLCSCYIKALKPVLKSTKVIFPPWKKSYTKKPRKPELVLFCDLKNPGAVAHMEGAHYGRPWHSGKYQTNTRTFFKAE